MFAALRIARRLRACLLLLFMCSVAAAVASPLLGPDAALALVCSGQGGLKLLDAGSDDPAPRPGASHSLDCPLCLPPGMPGLPDFAVAALGARPVAPGTGPAETLRLVSRVLRPPARAPPLDRSLKEALP
ncbi:DUF2946 domain-containing protein [Aquabacterium sp. OR-4]|uniref:DUF2946 domain-containing protein n=1 Tax=Aquabacterium sp. OR-4 TaxID=2978127 RepID=UPI0028CA9BEF|nr:DUF2946 domain-containing protein [Aquabacterium sp. OR-4]MDT7833671.1 DUF2946 domain-containing protein [Aquabacterium sp. OR-4]